MLINISELISTPLKNAVYEVPVEMEFYELRGDRFPFKEKRCFVSDCCKYRQSKGSFEWPVEGRFRDSL